MQLTFSVSLNTTEFIYTILFNYTSYYSYKPLSSLVLLIFCNAWIFSILGCRTLRRAASRRAKSLGVDKKSVRMPRCSKDGSFERIQCNNEIVSSCWCVDETGFELPGTRAPAAALVNCTGNYQFYIIPLQTNIDKLAQSVGS